MATTTLAGNSGNNLLNASGLESTLVQGFEGNDTINLARLDDSAEAGAGNDTIGLTKTGVQVNDISAGAGDDTVYVASATAYQNTIAGGDGGDSIKIGSAGSTSLITNVSIAANAGNDTIVFNTTNAARTISQSYVGLGQGNDSVRFGSATTFVSSDLFAGKGKDTITVAGVAGASSTINGGKGADLLELVGGTLTTAKIGAGAGADSIDFGTAAANAITGSIAGGGLSDTITFAAGLSGTTTTIFGDGNGVTTKGTGTGGSEDGADLIGSNSSDAGGASIYGGGGADSIYVGGASGLIHGGNGSDSIVINSAGASASVNGGAGTDVLRLVTAFDLVANLSTLNGGDGTDTVEWVGKNAAKFTGSTTNIVGIGESKFNLVAAGATSGDVIKLGGTAFVATTADNWLTGSAPTIFVFSAASQSLSAMGTGTGAIGVFSDSTDTYFAFASTAGQAANSFGYHKFVVQGVDLVTTTKFGGVAFNTTNFAFTLAQVSTVNDTGVAITLS